MINGISSVSLDGFAPARRLEDLCDPGIERPKSFFRAGGFVIRKVVQQILHRDGWRSNLETTTNSRDRRLRKFELLYNRWALFAELHSTRWYRSIDPPCSAIISFLSANGGALSGFNIDCCKVFDLPKIQDPRGNLTFIEGGSHVPFDIKRVYYLYDVPGGSERGGHAHKELHEFIIAMSGSFDVVLNDGQTSKRVHLCRSYYGLYVCPMIWRELDNFSSGSVCMVVASGKYDENDYYRDYSEFLRAQGLG